MWDTTFEPAGVTMSLPSVPNNTCRQHRNKFLTLNWTEYDIRCNATVLHNKARLDTLKVEELDTCYVPNCKNSGEEYSRYQCSFLIPNFCWCSDANGVAIPGTNIPGLRYEDCGMPINFFMTLWELFFFLIHDLYATEY